ncbi:MAG: ABC-F family ATP-binding cassette domain-containing protein [Pseudomonadota bacterium]
MTTYLTAKEISHQQGSRLLFERLDLSIAQGDRIALVGHNGCGKTTLLRLLCRELKADDGQVQHRQGLRCATVAQFIAPELLGQSAAEATREVLQDASETYRADAMLSGFGFDEQTTQRPIETLSGGQQNLVAFARARLTEPELLLMDEPGNHMDVVAQQALMHFLSTDTKLTYLLISHDREMLDRCCNRTIFLRDRRTHSFDLPFSAAREALAEQDEQAGARLEKEEKEIARVRASAKRISTWSRAHESEKLARKAKSMERRVEQLEARKTTVSAGHPLSLNLDAKQLRSKTVLTLEQADITTPDGTLLAHCDLAVLKPGERIGLVGINGSGKSTTIQHILRAQTHPRDTIRLNPNASIGYLDQELGDLNGGESRYEWLRQRLEHANDDTITRALVNAGVAWADFDQPVNTLSGGEKSRTAFVQLALARPGFLILDEPTNHIDLIGREELEAQLIAAQASVLITSHDRKFLETVCTGFWMIADGRLQAIDTLDRFYAALVEPGTREDASPSATATSITPTSEEALLQRIEALESLLAADRARKPKFQKPDRQQQWQAELDELWLKLP